MNELYVVFNMDYEKYREYHRAEPVLIRAFETMDAAEDFIDDSDAEGTRFWKIQPVPFQIG